MEGLGFEGLGFKGLGFQGSGFKGLGLKGLGLKGLGLEALASQVQTFLSTACYGTEQYPLAHRISQHQENTEFFVFVSPILCRLAASSLHSLENNMFTYSVIVLVYRHLKSSLAQNSGGYTLSHPKLSSTP